MEGQQKLIPSGRNNACPVCGRTKDGDCRTTPDGAEVICHHPKEHRPGEVITGADGIAWAFTGNTKDGRAGHFTLDKPKDGTPSRLPRRSIQSKAPELEQKPEPAPLPDRPPALARMAPREPAGSPYRYSPTQLVKRVPLPDGDKVFYGFHLAEGVWEKGAGPGPWPVFNHADTINAVGWILETEGEKCAEIAAACGVVTISQPGHAHIIEQIVPRYRALHEAGIAGLIYLADHDGPQRPVHQQEGRRRAENAAEAAALAGLPIIIIPAIDLWPGIPDGGSIDNAPDGDEMAVQDIVEAAVEAYWTMVEPEQELRQPGPITVEQVRQRYQTAIESGASRADLETERLALAAASDLHPAALRDLFKSLELEQEAAQAITAETRAIRDAGEQKAMAEGLRLDYLLPPSLAQALAIRTKWLPADDVAAIMAYLVCISGLVKLGTEIVACPAAGYKVPLNLYVCLVAKSGAKKSPLSRKLVSEPTITLRLDLARQHDRAVQNWAEQNRGVKPAERTDPPQPAYISVTDATAEALTHQLQVQENRGLPLLWERDELAGLIGGLNAYRGGRGGDSEQLLEAYDGSGFRSLRIATTGGGRSYQRCHLSIWGTIQPAVLGELVKGGDASGLWARFAFVPLPEVVVPLAEHQTQSDLEASQWAEGLLMGICDHIYRLPRSSLALSPEGRSAFIAYEARCQRDALDAVIPAQGALMAKSAGKALRLAGLIHLLHQACPDGQHSNTIGAEAISKATTLTDYLNSWALGLHASAADGPNDLMQLIHKVAKAFGNQAVGWREIYSRLSKSQRRDSDAGAAAQAMEALAALGVGEVIKGARGATTYRATGDL
jgi:CRISPR-associated protein Cmr3